MGTRLALAAAVVGMFLAPTAAALELGEKAPRFHVTDIRYLPRTLSDFGEREAYVIVFTSGSCPIVRRYLPRLEELNQAYRERGVEFIAINVAPDEDVRQVAYLPLEYNVSFHFVKDMDGSAVNALGASRTPECLVLDKDMRLQYRGRVDDQFRVSGLRPEPTRHDLERAIEDVLAGREVELPETPVDGCEITVAGPPAGSDEFTFANHVAPIIYENCASCHRPGQSAPFSLLSYDDVASKARVIAHVVRQKSMPPWYAHDDYGDFYNDRRLSAEERDIVVRWALGSREAGNLDEAPEPPTFPSAEWRFGEPDMVIQAAEPFELPATGYIDYQYVPLPYQFPHDTYIQGIEIKPGNTAVVHHANLVFLDERGRYDGANNFLTGYVPGGLPAQMLPGHAMVLPKGSTLMLQIHYVTTGKPETDQISVGLRYARGTIDKRVRYKIVEDGKFEIQPGAPMHRTYAERVIEEDATALGLFSHMHVRGRDMTFVAEYPDGNEETLLSLPNYSFDWQLSYLYEPGKKLFPAGTKVKVTAHFDNSPFNPFNPDPADTVRYGPQTHEEMMIGYVFYTVNDERLQLAINPENGAILEKTAQAN